MALAPENLTVHTLALKKGARLRQEDTPLPTGDQVGRHAGRRLGRAGGGGICPLLPLPAEVHVRRPGNVGWTRPGYVNQYNICMMEELHTVLSLGAGGVTKFVENGVVRRMANPKYPQEYLRTIDTIRAEKAAWV